MVNWIINEKNEIHNEEINFLIHPDVNGRGATKAADVTFKASAPQAVVMGEQFRLTFTVNAEGKGI